jgi:hypothetical protein
MRRMSILLFLVNMAIFLTGETVFAQNKPSKSNSSQFERFSDKAEKGRDCLEVSGKATINGKPIHHVSIKFFRGDTLIAEIPSTRKEKVYLVMKENTHYTITYSAKGYVTRLIEVDTQLPRNVRPNPVFTFDFDLELPLESKGYNPDYSDFPVALISYNKLSHKFEYNRQYTSNIKKGMGDTLQVQSAEEKHQ